MSIYKFQHFDRLLSYKNNYNNNNNNTNDMSNDNNNINDIHKFHNLIDYHSKQRTHTNYNYTTTTTNSNNNKIWYLNMSCIRCEKIPQMSQMSVLWQIPQFMLMGVSEILAAVASLEFFYSQSPKNMRSVIQSLNLGTTALGSFFMIPLLYFVNNNPNKLWITDNLDEGYLSLYFILLGSIMLVNHIYFWYISRNYIYV